MLLFRRGITVHSQSKIIFLTAGILFLRFILRQKVKGVGPCYT